MKGSLLCQNSAESKAGKAKNGGKKGQAGVFGTLSPEPDTTLLIERRVFLLYRINVAIIISEETYISALSPFFGLRNVNQLSSPLPLIQKRWFNCTINFV